MKLQAGHARDTPVPQEASRLEGPLRATAARSTWLSDFFPGYFALMMGIGIVAVTARLPDYELIAWPLLRISLLAYAVLWVLLLARDRCAFRVRHPRTSSLPIACSAIGSCFRLAH